MVQLLRKYPKPFQFALVTVIILLFYHFRFGLGILNPTHVAWVVDNVELATGFFSFSYFRHQPWGFPIGSIHYYFYPLGSNLYLSDLPLLSILFKPFSGLLPQEFQYTGIWYLASHLLQAWFALLLCQRFGINGFTRIITVLLLSFTPVLLSRFIHPTLFCQWMILAGFYIYFIDPEKTSSSRILFYQWILSTVTALVFVYLWVFAMGFCVALLIRLWLLERRIKVQMVLGQIILNVVSAVIIWFVIGLISWGNTNSYQMAGWGLYSANLNSFFNPMDTGSLLPTLPFFPEQGLEGYVYLGAGLITLILVVGILSIKKRYIDKKDSTQWYLVCGVNTLPLILIAGLSAVYSFSSKLTFGNQVLLQFDVSNVFAGIVNSFRSSGRFLWILYYSIILLALYAYNQFSLSSATRNLVLGCCLIIQLYDIQYFLRPAQTNPHASYQPPVQRETWDRLIESFDTVMIYPGYRRGYLQTDDFRYFTYYAARHNKPINTGYVARVDQARVAGLTKELGSRILTNGLENHVLYISIATYLNALAVPIYHDDTYCYSIDGYLAIFKKTSESKSLAEFLEKNNAVNIQGVIAQQSLMRRWDGFRKSLEISQAKSGFYETDDSEDHFYIKGWAFPEDSSMVAYDSVYLVLESALKERWIAPVHSFQTPDVASFFHLSEKVNTGYGVSLLKKNLSNGAYHAGLLFKDSKTGIRTLHWMEYYVKVNKTITPVLVEALKNTRELKSNIYALTDTLDNVQVESWAFPAQGICRSCKPFYTLRSKTKTYIAEAMIVPKPDVVSYFNDTSLLNTGMETKFSKKSMARGYYKLGMLLQDTISLLGYFSETDKIISAGIEEYGTPSPMTEEPVGKDSIRAYVDKVEDGKDVMRIDGWAFINQLSTNDSETSLILKSPERTYSLPTTPVSRPDVQAFFKLPNSIDESGFSVKFRKDKVPSGSYELCVVILNKKTNMKTLSRLGNKVKI